MNFLSTADAERVMERFIGFQQWKVVSFKVCDVTWGDEQVQGLQAHTERYRNSHVMHESVPDVYKPAIFLGGVRVPFPPPTKRLRPPAGLAAKLHQSSRVAITEEHQQDNC